MVRKTTTQEEKLDLLVEFFIEKALPFSLKELENQVPKTKPACSFVNLIFSYILILIFVCIRISINQRFVGTTSS